ncbi:MAG TPA: hypothetical protein VN661_12350 [Candidatus Acidoferrales bacterium]|nr:hypothetical protein [Candidatus Acidoferrales bacterium]
MAVLNYQAGEVNTLVTRPNWGAIWAGAFTFIAIWSVFGLLGMAIFASAANPAAPQPITGMSIGMAIWIVILTIIAMYVAGRVTGHLAGIANSRDGMTHGMIMFGLSVTAAIALIAFAGSAATGGTTLAAVGSHSPYVLTLFADMGWVGFAALLLGWVAAMGGASTGAKMKVIAPQPPRATT